MLALLPSSSTRDDALQFDPPERSEFPLAPDVWVLEGAEYRYLFKVPALAENVALTTLHPELFFPDDEKGRSGRFRPGTRVGTVHGAVLVGSELVGVFGLEVRSSKLGYLEEYRSMLDDIADIMSDLVLQDFAPTEVWLSPESPGYQVAAYQRVAFLKNFIGCEAFDRAVHRIISRPHLKWDEFEEMRKPGQGIGGRSSVSRALVAPGPRIPWGSSSRTNLSTLPRTMRGLRTEADTDTVENRFVKFVLELWRDFLVQTQFALGQLGATAAVGRGIREVEALTARLDQVIAADLFRSLGPLLFVPSNSKVLQREEGYRDIFRAFVQYHATARVSWTGGEEVFSAGQRNVATLYEYWCFLKVAQIAASVAEQKLDVSQLLEPGGTSKFRLRRGQSLALEMTTKRNRQPVLLNLWFNRTFRTAGVRESWTRALRPDVSLSIKARGSVVWLHFDAKYQVEPGGPLGDTREEEEAVLEQEARGVVKRASLMKMHAYRDAIFNSAGVYVLYPGDVSDRKAKYEEILPGLGAFVLRPLPNGEAVGAVEVKGFINDVLSFLTSPSKFARARRASRRIYGREG